ncbi:hypothetical protein PR003_g2493 [Phytophthora rubi]|uniref:Uncharacterized protein n=1 Tax=Phytophthora rubi TaxID=129364 RepID=A0A6A3NT78_9STRA|nr:hypothetical protein PR002_g325 [Phytophthora rubi]KAE9356103.1 hypothetical protein PR003_g2493 [Phytophthora rubi]
MDDGKSNVLAWSWATMTLNGPMKRSRSFVLPTAETA